MDLLDRLEGRAEEYELAELREETILAEYEANRLKNCSVAEERGAALRVIRGDRLGFAASTDASAGEALVANALDSAAYGDRAGFRFAAPAALPSPRCLDERIAGLGVERLAEMGGELVELALAAEPEARCSAGASRSLVEARVRTSRGLDAAYRASPLRLFLEIDRIEGDDILILYDELSSTAWEEDYLAFARRLAGKLEKARRIVPMEGGRMPVLFSPQGALALGFPVKEALCGKEVLTRGSPLAGKAGERLFDPKLTIVDDGTLDGMAASSPCDGEGMPRRRNVLVEAGTLKGFVFDLKTAARLGVESTGSASRELWKPPEPGFTSFSIEPGTTPVADMIASIDEGIVVEDLLGLGQGNILSGAFSNPLALAFKVERGEIVGRVKGLSIAGNVYEALRDVAALSLESEWVYGAYRAPWMLLDGVSVAGKGGR